MPLAAPLIKRYEYKVFSPTGSYLGIIPSALIQSDFGYNQLIGTAFAQMQITVSQSADVAGGTAENLTDEIGNPIQDESGNNIQIERQPDIVGSSNSNNLIANNNLIQVYEYSSYYPNGVKVFDGYISKWKTIFGGDDDIVVTCLSNGNDLNQYLVSSGDTTFISQATDNGSSVTSTSAGLGQWIIQTFSVASAIQISAVSLELTATVQAIMQVSIKQQLSTSPNPGSDPIVASGSVVVPIQTKTVTKLSFTSPTTLNPAYTYYTQIFWQDSSNLTIFASSTQPYAAGNVYTLSSSGTTFNTPVLQSGYSLYFIVWQYGGSVLGAYTNQDPATIMTNVMSNYASQGGLITPPTSTLNALFRQPIGDTNIPGAFWSTAVAQVLSPTSNITFDSIQIKLPVGSTSVPTPGLYTGNPALDTVTVISGGGSYGLGGSNAAVSIPAVASTSINSNTGIATIVFASSITLTGGTAYYLLWFFPQGSYQTLIGDSSLNAAPSAPFGSLYTGLVLANNTSAGMSKPAGIQAMYMVLGLGAGSSPNGGFSNTGTLTSYTFKMQTILQAIQAIMALSPSNWYWYVDPATGVLQYKQASTTADITIIKGRHINELDIEATKENVKNVAYFSGGDDGSGTNTNILVKVTGTKGANDRTGLVLLADNRVNSTNGGTVTAKLIAQNYLNGHNGETYITNVTLQDQTIDTTAIKLGMMVGFAGFGNFVEGLLLQVVGVNRGPDQTAFQLGTLPVRDSKAVADIAAALAYQQTVANATVPS